MGLQTYPDVQVNKISDKLKKYLEERALKPGEIVKYKLLNGVKNIDPNRRKGDDWLYPASIMVAGATRIIDPGTNRPVQIGVVKNIDPNTKTPTFRKYYVKPGRGENGIFTINANRVEESDFYELLELSNNNASNPYRDTSVQPIYERIDEIKQASQRSDKRNYLKMSWDSIKQWNDKETKAMAAAYNIPTNQSRSVLKDILESIAEKDPEGFYKMIDSDDTKIAAIIRLSIEKGIIEFNPVENKWIYKGNGETAALLDRREGVDEFEGLKQFLKSAANGPLVTDKLKGLLKIENDAAKKGK